MNYRKTLKVLAVAVLAGLGALVSPSRVLAVNGPDAASTYFDESGAAQVLYGGANTNSCIDLSYVGVSTESLVTISATAMTFYAPYNTLDNTVGTSGVITYSSTLGANTIDGLCNYLNGLNNNSQKNGSNYKCVKTNCKGNDVPGTMLKTQTESSGTNALNAVGGFAVLMTTNTTVQLGIQPAKGKRVVLYQVVTTLSSSSGANVAANSLNIYGQLRKYGTVASATPQNGAGNSKDPFGTVANDTYLVWQSTVANATAASIPNSTVPYVQFQEFAQDAHVVIVGGNSAAGSSSAAQTSADSIQVMWGEK